MEFTGKTVEEATKSGLESLGIDESQAEITVIEEPVKGLFGKVKKDAVVEIKKKEAKQVSGTEKAADFILKVFGIMNIDAKAEITGENKITLTAKETSEVIGYRGEVLDAIQVLAGAVANIGNKEYKKVVVDCEDYRVRREETLVALAHKLEAKATETRRKVVLEPMSPYERRIIHTALAESETVKTESDGKEPARHVVIVPNDLDKDAKPYYAGTNHGRNGRNGRDGKGGRRNDRRGGGNFKGRGNSHGGSGFTEVKRKASPTFGTYLGNSLKDKNI